MNKLEVMKIFLAVCEQGSFVGASRALNISAPVVTRSIAQLEDYLQVLLFNRTTRSIVLTEAGRIYQQESQRILDELQSAEDLVSGSYVEPQGQLRISAPVMFGQLHLMPIICAFLDDFPKVNVQLKLQDHVINLLDEHIDVALRIGHLKDSGLYAIKVGQVRQITCCSPAFADAHGVPNTPEEVSNFTTITTNTQSEMSTWRYYSNGKEQNVKLKCRFKVSDNNAAVQAAIRGQGLTQRMSYQVSDGIRAGSLVRLLKDFENEPLPVNLIHLAGRKANARTKQFIEYAAAKLRDNIALNAD
ncbi:LysR family transcriptional regulator [Alteromonas sp. ASW11-36]|uniref:LysR family transcriptional regulator n=1 Tax=Alteromonas arenosi TaxID=3055817 RepID=A0ABT7SUG1_9ALTE|nr:LysR family transcriptional regulator [Alteromonas sp. ASW11-36]MDM7859187.1 LysR family transcriptional regulator [Alteromonas sp. ASW11-36]